MWLLWYTEPLRATALQLNPIFVSTDPFRRRHTLNMEAVRTPETLVDIRQEQLVKLHIKPRE
jgi:hypothetical protein